MRCIESSIVALDGGVNTDVCRNLQAAFARHIEFLASAPPFGCVPFVIAMARCPQLPSTYCATSHRRRFLRLPRDASPHGHSGARCPNITHARDAPQCGASCCLHEPQTQECQATLPCLLLLTSNAGAAQHTGSDDRISTDHQDGAARKNCGEAREHTRRHCR